MVRKKESISILNLSANKARNFFLKEESYCSFDLPAYFKFEPLLGEIYKKICGKRISDYFSGQKPRDFEGVNHKILNNKDGKYSWRPFQLIHPALYVELVCRLTEKENWKIIIDRFKKFSANKKIQCSSIPIDSISKHSDKASLINIWWNEIEQKSIELALDFQYIIKTDIADCYGSIYSHSVAWAIHGKSFAKKNKKQEYIGNVIDLALQNMHHGQTNGIPQGSALMDFIAEIVLGYADKKLSKKLSNLKIAESDYFILRYRDDYRIFINNLIVGELITKCLCEVLISLGLKLNSEKTTSSQNIISRSIKPDKLFWLQQKQQHNNIQKHMLIIYEFSRKYPNSGSLIVALQDLYSRLPKVSISEKDVMPLISIIVDISFNSPKLYPDCAAVLSFLISQFKSKSKKLEVIKKITNRFAQIPNTGHLQIWLQRISLRFTNKPRFDEILCEKLVNKSVIVWDSAWLENSFKEMIDKYPVVDYDLIDNLPEIIGKEEVDLFHAKQVYYD